jgi:hypothetical protein
VLDDPDEFVAQNAAEIHVPAGDFQVGGADARLADADQRIAVGRRGLGLSRPEGERLIED